MRFGLGRHPQRGARRDRLAPRGARRRPVHVAVRPVRARRPAAVQPPLLRGAHQRRRLRRSGRAPGAAGRRPRRGPQRGLAPAGRGGSGPGVAVRRPAGRQRRRPSRAGPRARSRKVDALERDASGCSAKRTCSASIFQGIPSIPSGRSASCSPRTRVAELGTWTDQPITLGVVVTAIKRQVSKRSGQEFARLTVEDFSGSSELLVFPEAWAAHRRPDPPGHPPADQGELFAARPGRRESHLHRGGGHAVRRAPRRWRRRHQRSISRRVSTCRRP